MVALQAGAAGFLDAPVTRGLCAAVASGTVAAWVAEGKGVQVSNVVARELLQQLGLATAWQAIVCLSLLYNFRLLERRVGSGRFGAFVAYGVACSSIARAVSSRVLPDLRWLPGPVSIVVACVPPVLCNVASPAAASMFGLPITGKAYVLMAVTQVRALPVQIIATLHVARCNTRSPPVCMSHQPHRKQLFSGAYLDMQVSSRMRMFSMSVTYFLVCSWQYQAGCGLSSQLSQAL